MERPRRGEVWWAVLDPVVGTELGGHLEGEARPILIVSDDAINQGLLNKVFTVPLSTRNRGYPTHVPLPPHRPRSFIYCEDVRSISVQHLRQRAYPAPVPQVVMSEVEDRLRLLLGI